MKTNWRVLYTKSIKKTGKITEVTFEYSHSSNGKTSIRTTSTIKLVSPSGAIIPYSEISEEVIINWVKEILGLEVVNTIEANSSAVYNALSSLYIEEESIGTPWTDGVLKFSPPRIPTIEV